jgi:hypothetical protein
VDISYITLIYTIPPSALKAQVMSQLALIGQAKMRVWEKLTRVQMGNKNSGQHNPVNLGSIIIELNTMI